MNSLKVRLWAVLSLLAYPIAARADMPAAGGTIAIASHTFELDELDQPVQLVEPEIDPGLLQDLPAPEPVGNAANLPKMIITRDEWQGGLCGIAHPAHAVFRHRGTWEQFWTQAVRPYAPHQVEVPTVDFQKDMVLAVFAGEKPTPGYEIRMLSVKVQEEGGEKLLVVRFKNEQKMRGVFNPPLTIRPFHLKRVPAFAGRVLFLDDNR